MREALATILGKASLSRPTTMTSRRRVNLKSIQTRRGHSSVRVRGDRYPDLLQAVEDGSMAALDAFAMTSVG